MSNIIFKIDRFLLEEESGVKKIVDIWKKDNPDLTNQEIKEVLQKFREIKSKNLIKLDWEKKIENWENWEKFNEFIDSLYKKIEGKKTAKADIEVIKDNDVVTIVVPKTFEATRSFVNSIDAVCPWCISSSNGFWYFDRYSHILGVTPYIVHFKQDSEKSETNLITFSVYPDGKKVTTWKRTDNKKEIDTEEQFTKLKELGIPRSSFISKTKLNDGFEKELMKNLKGVKEETFDLVKDFVIRNFNTIGLDLYNAITKQGKHEKKDYDEKDWKIKIANHIITSTNIPDEERDTVRKWIKNDLFTNLIRGKKYIWKK